MLILFLNLGAQKKYSCTLLVKKSSRETGNGNFRILTMRRFGLVNSTEVAAEVRANEGSF